MRMFLQITMQACMYRFSALNASTQPLITYPAKSQDEVSNGLDAAAVLGIVQGLRAAAEYNNVRACVCCVGAWLPAEPLQNIDMLVGTHPSRYVNMVTSIYVFSHRTATLHPSTGDHYGHAAAAGARGGGVLPRRHPAQPGCCGVSRCVCVCICVYMCVCIPSMMAALSLWLGRSPDYYCVLTRQLRHVHSPPTHTPNAHRPDRPVPALPDQCGSGAGAGRRPGAGGLCTGASGTRVCGRPEGGAWALGCRHCWLCLNISL